MSYLLDELKKIEHLVGDEFSRFETHLGAFLHPAKRTEENNRGGVLSDLLEAEKFFKSALAGARDKRNAEVVRFIGKVTGTLALQLEADAIILRNIDKDANE